MLADDHIEDLIRLSRIMRGDMLEDALELLLREDALRREASPTQQMTVYGYVVTRR